MTTVTLTLNAKLQPFHRHDIEDALEAKLEELGVSAQIDGGGTSQEPNGEVASCDIFVFLDEPSDVNLNTITRIMESMLAPVGSELSYQENETVKKIPFGKQEGLGLYFSEELEKEVYENCNVNFVYQEIERLLGDFKTGHIASYWEGAQTAFYLYGEQFDEMHKRIQPILNDYPLCQKCKVVQIA